MLEQALVALKANNIVLAETLLMDALTVPAERHQALRLLVRFSINQNKFAEAVFYAEQLLIEHPDKADYYHSLSQLYQLNYEVVKEHQLWQQFVQHWPAEHSGWFNLSVAARKSHNAELAQKAITTWFDLTGNHIEFLFQQALICSELLRQEHKATELLQELLLLRPDHHAALFNLGHLSEQLGELKQAAMYFQAACQCKSDDATSWARWLELAKPSAQELQLYQQRFGLLLSEPQHSSQVDLCYALGLNYDRLGLYTQAWHYYQKANLDDRRFLPPYQAKQTLQLIEDCLQRQNLVWPTLPESSEKPILICGMFRSGSTLAEQLLAASGQVACGGEMEFLHRQLYPLIRHPQALLAKAIEPDFLPGYLQQIASIKQGNTYFTDKRPENFLYLDVVFQYFPKAKVIWTRRQLADNVLSVYFHRLGPGMNYATDLDATLHYEQQQRKLMRHWQQLYPERIFELDYDELVHQPDTTLTALFGFLGLKYSDEAERFHQLDNAVKTASVTQVRRPLYQQASGRYLNYRDAILKGDLFPLYQQLLNSQVTDHKG